MFWFHKKSFPATPRRLFGVAHLAAIKDVFRYYQKTGVDFGYQGEFEKRYTDAFVAYQGGGYADAVATGTASVFVAVATLELPVGSHVICSPVTDPGTVSAIILNGHKVVIMDSMPGSYNSGPDQFLAAVTPETRAVVLVHAAGKAAPVDRIVELARARGIRVVEDCSQAHGASLGGKKVGTFGDIAAFSTMYRKAHATGGCGGVVYTRDRALYWKARSYADRGKPFEEEPFDEKDVRLFRFPALNLNLDELSCAIGTVTLKELDITRKKRFALWQRLKEKLHEYNSTFVTDNFSEEDSIFFIPIKKPTDWLQKPQEFGVHKSLFNFSYKYVVSEWPWLNSHLNSPDKSSSPNALAKRNASIHLLLNENFSLKDISLCAKLLSK